MIHRFRAAFLIGACLCMWPAAPVFAQEDLPESAISAVSDEPDATFDVTQREHSIASCSVYGVVPSSERSTTTTSRRHAHG